MAFDLDDDELKATRRLNGVDKGNKINDFIEIYNEIKQQSSIIGNIDKEFFFKFVDCLLSEYTTQKQVNEEHQKINKDLRKQIKRLDKTNNDLRLLFRRTANKLLENGKEELATYFLAQIDDVPTFTVDDDIDYYEEYYKLKKSIRDLKEPTQIISPYYVKENYIPKQKIKDKIENLKSNLKFIACSKDCNKCFDKKGNVIYRGSNFMPCFAYHQIKVLQELLQREDK